MVKARDVAAAKAKALAARVSSRGRGKAPSAPGFVLAGEGSAAAGVRNKTKRLEIYAAEKVRERGLLERCVCGSKGGARDGGGARARPHVRSAAHPRLAGGWPLRPAGGALTVRMRTRRKERRHQLFGTFVQDQTPPTSSTCLFSPELFTNLTV